MTVFAEREATPTPNQTEYSSMDTFSAFAIGKANRGKPQRVFDWDKAARLIRELSPVAASAGLAEDYGWTGGPIYKDGKPVSRDDTYTYLASTWATPQLYLEDRSVECWLWAKDVPADWGTHHAEIYWPESALQILTAPVPEVVQCVS